MAKRILTILAALMIGLASAHAQTDDTARVRLDQSNATAAHLEKPSKKKLSGSVPISGLPNGGAMQLGDIWPATRSTTTYAVNGSNLCFLNSCALTTPLSVSAGGTATATPSLVAGSNVTITGSWPDQTINSSGGGGSVSITAASSNVVVSPSPLTGTGTIDLSSAPIVSGVMTALNFAASGTGANLLPVGTTGQRPTAVAGMLRYNSTVPTVEAYFNNAWNNWAVSI
jgi:hypothetical protein